MRVDGRLLHLLLQLLARRRTIAGREQLFVRLLRTQTFLFDTQLATLRRLWLRLRYLGALVVV